MSDQIIKNAEQELTRMIEERDVVNLNMHGLIGRRTRLYAKAQYRANSSGVKMDGKPEKFLDSVDTERYLSILKGIEFDRERKRRLTYQISLKKNMIRGRKARAKVSA